MKILFFIFLLLIFTINIAAKPIPVEIKKQDNKYYFNSNIEVKEETYYLFNEDDMNETLSYMEALTKPVIIPKKSSNTGWYIITSVLVTSLLFTSTYIYFKEIK